MKRTSFLTLLFITFQCFAQDSSKVAIARKLLGIQQEFAFDATLLMKQVFNLSGSSLPTLPYDLTYKVISGKSAIRVGFGVSVSNSSVASTITTSPPNINAPATGPDPQVPTTNNSMNVFYRVGYERRIKLDHKFVFYYGLDLVGQNGTSGAQSSETFNNLPSEYIYQKTTDNIKTNVYGAGPVAGLQWFLTKRLSIFTEIPVYLEYSNSLEVTDNYADDGTAAYNFLSGGYVYTYTPSDNKQTTTTKSSTLSVSLPVTIFLSFTF